MVTLQSTDTLNYSLYCDIIIITIKTISIKIIRYIIYIDNFNNYTSTIRTHTEMIQFTSAGGKRLLHTGRQLPLLQHASCSSITVTVAEPC